MRLFELSTRYIDDLKTILRNQIGHNDTERASATLTYSALSSLLANLGYGMINQQIFQKIYDDNPDIQPLVIDFDEDKVVLGTKVQNPKENPESNLPVLDRRKEVDSMARQGARTHLRNISK
jgi:hypothetical protein